MLQNKTVIMFQWTTSKAKETGGVNICTLFVDQKKVASKTGGGASMEDEVLREWIVKTYGLNLADNTARASLVRALNSLGLDWTLVESTRNSTTYWVTPKT